MCGLNEKLHMKDYVTQRELQLKSMRMSRLQRSQARSCPGRAALRSAGAAGLRGLTCRGRGLRPQRGACEHGLCPLTLLCAVSASLGFWPIRSAAVPRSISFTARRAVETKLKPMRRGAPSPLPTRGNRPLPKGQAPLQPVGPPHLALPGLPHLYFQL